MARTSPIFDKAAISERIRALVASHDTGDWEALAAFLGVDAVGLHMSLDELAPQPTLEVIAAIIRVYGVDPTWLLSGEYSGVTHRTAAASDTPELHRMLQEMVGDDLPLALNDQRRRGRQRPARSDPPPLADVRAAPSSPPGTRHDVASGPNDDAAPRSDRR